MKGIVAKLVVILAVYVYVFKNLDIQKYEYLENLWFGMDIIGLLFISFFVMCINVFCFQITTTKYNLWFLALLFLTMLCFMCTKIELSLILLWLNVFISAYLVNLLYKENKLSGYLLIVNLIFISYYLVVNQMAILIK